MSRSQRAFSAVVALGLLVGAVALAAPAESSPVTGSAGLDTSLKVTDSKVTVSGRGPYADLRVTVNQTKNLLNQAVSITWTGAGPSRTGPGRFGANYLQIMQCWGDDDGTVAANPGPPPEQCIAGAVNGVFGGATGGLFPGGSFNTERIISAKGWPNFDPAAGTFDERSGFVWRPFRSVTGAEVGVHIDPNFNPDGTDGSYWLNPFFNIVTTNEIAAGRTGPNGTGAELFEVTTGVESSGLGCGQSVQTIASGAKKIPKCWLVVVPRGLPAYENTGTPFASAADEFGVMTSPLAAHPWQNRIAIPLEFTPVDSSCSLADDQRRIVGSELVVPAVSSWQPKLCDLPDLSPYAYGLVSDASARQQLLNPLPGAPGMVVVSRPVNPDQSDPDNPITYAPLSLSGVVIGFNVERSPKPTADRDAQQVAGVRIGALNLTPRLVAKLLTQSYRSQVDIKAIPSGYEWVKSNPLHLGVDPDFVRFNPEFDELQLPSGKNFGGLLLPAGNSDVALQVWEYVLADPEARAWLDGTADENGMNVNPIYATKAATNSTGAAFADPIPQSFPKSDPHCFEGEPVGPSKNVVPPPLCGTDWLPFVQSFRDASRLTRLADDGAKVVEDPVATRPDQVYKRDIPQQIGTRVMMSLTDSASAFQYGLQTARLSRAGDNGDKRSFVAPDAAGFVAGFQAMKPGDEPAVLEPDPTARVEGAYPLTALTYAAIRPLSLDERSRKEYAAFVGYAAGDGQVSGFGDGKLPEGYAPLPASLKTQSTNAAKAIVEMKAPIAAEAGETPRAGSDDVANDAAPGFSESAAFGGLTRNPVIDFSDPATITQSPVVAASDAPSSIGSAIRRLLTPAVAIPLTRMALPALFVVAVLGALATYLLGRRKPESTA